MDLEENGGELDFESNYSQPPFPDVYHSRGVPPQSFHQEEYHHHQSAGYHHQHHQHHPHRHHHYPQAQGWGNDGWGRPHPPPMAGAAPLPEYAFSALNAEARKKLPAWIREGLEKGSILQNSF
jgi:hypothetical protein